MSKRQSGYFGRLWAALVGKQTDSTPEPAPRAGSPEARIASLEMDVRERDARIAAMQTEYETLRHDSARAGAANAEQEQMVKRIVAPLANLVALRSLADSGKAVSAPDVLSLVGDLLQELRKGGLEQIGTVGELTEFNSALHQRMSGTGVHSGVPVLIRLPGFKKDEKILVKAMVSTRTEGDGASRG